MAYLPAMRGGWDVMINMGNFPDVPELAEENLDLYGCIN
jgi:hypothetical protein